MICSQPRLPNLLGAAPAVSRAIRLTSTELCREKQRMQRSRLSISQSRRRSVLGCIFEVKHVQYIVFQLVPANSMLCVRSLLQPPCDMMNAVEQTKPTSEELRGEVKELRSTAARLIEQASRPDGKMC